MKTRRTPENPRPRFSIFFRSIVFRMYFHRSRTQARFRRLGLPSNACPRRYNIATFHNPELRESLESLSPESELLELIDLTLADDLQHGSLSITAEALEEKIRIYHERRANQIFTYRQACGKYLHRLSVKAPARLKSLRTATERLWRISPKPSESDGCDGCDG